MGESVTPDHVNHAERVTHIVEIISAGLQLPAGELVVSQEQRVLIDEEVRAEMAASVAEGWRTQDEADATYWAWRAEFFGDAAPAAEPEQPPHREGTQAYHSPYFYQ